MRGKSFASFRMQWIAWKYKTRFFLYLLKRGKFKEIYNWIWFHLFWASNWFSNLFFLKIWDEKRQVPKFIKRPPFVEIETTTACGANCIYCENTYWNVKPRLMRLDEFKKLVDQFDGLKWAGMTGIGDSYKNPDYLDMLAYLKSKNVLVQTHSLFDNISSDISRALIDIGVDNIFCSMHAATKETYEKLVPNAQFERVLANLKSFIKIQEEKKSMKPILCFHFVVNKYNIDEMNDFLDLVHSLKGEGNVFQVLFSEILHPFKEIKDLKVPITQEKRREIVKKAAKLGIHVNFNVDVGELPPMNKCTAWIMPFIFSTGHVINCCCNNEGNRREWQVATSFGNASEENFTDVWFSKRYAEMRRKLRDGELPEECQYCPVFEKPSSYVSNLQIFQEQLNSDTQNCLISK